MAVVQEGEEPAWRERATRLGQSMKIVDIITSIGLSGSVYKDLPAIKAGAIPDGPLLYKGEPVTPGFTKIVQPGRTVSIQLVLEDGTVACGDCAEVILVGIAGREPMFVPEKLVEIIEGPIAKALVGRDASRFRSAAEEFDRFEVSGKRIHPALRYGLSQALLDAAALSRRMTATEVIADEYGLTPRDSRLPILAGALRLDWAQHDRMILKRADVLPHTPFLSVRDHVGEKGELLVDYMTRLIGRIGDVGEPDYRPTIHIDLYGTLGEAFSNDTNVISEFVARLGELASPYRLLVESPVIGRTQQEQIDIYGAVQAGLKALGSNVRLVIDEWANTLDDIKALHAAGVLTNVQLKTPDLGSVTNTIEALNFCRANGIDACLGGSANETDLSARITAHVGLACGAAMMSTKPGQGGDEGWMILVNEMERTLARIRARRRAGG
ncbi:MAG: methylaspartate ammonia-lyase [Rhizobiaceae bacterium]